MRLLGVCVGVLLLALLLIAGGLLAAPAKGPWMLLAAVAMAGFAVAALCFQIRAVRLTDGPGRLAREGPTLAALSPILLGFGLLMVGIAVHKLSQPWPGAQARHFQGRPAAMHLEPTGEAGRRSLIVLPVKEGLWASYDCHGERRGRGGTHHRPACWSGSALTTYAIGARLPVVDLWSRQGRILGLIADGRVLVDFRAERRDERQGYWGMAVGGSLLALAILTAWIFILRRLLQSRRARKDMFP